MDEDSAVLTREELIAEVKKLRADIREHRILQSMSLLVPSQATGPASGEDRS